jgi:serine protease Do
VTLEKNPDDKELTPRKKKTYQGQKAPFGLGFSVTNYSLELAKELGLPRLDKNAVVVIDIEAGAPAERAGLGIGDIIIDVNKVPVAKDVDVLKRLKDNQINSLRIFRGGAPALVYINPRRGN